MNLVENAIESIEVGVEDYQLNVPRRVASAVRNFYAGVLLLLKEKLRQLSPADSNEALLRERVEFQCTPAGVIFVGTGKKTVDVEEIKRRFRSLKLPLDTHRLDKLRAIRNDIEHYASRHSHSRVQEAIAQTFVLVTRVMSEHLAMSPADTFTGPVWRTMLSEAETFREVEKRCQRALLTLDGVPSAARDVLKRLVCPKCDSSLLMAESNAPYAESEFTCQACASTCALDEVIERAIAESYAGDAYRAVKDGEEGPLDLCPTCSREAYHRKDDVCLACGESRPYPNCLRCGSDLMLDEQFDKGMCSYCCHMYEKLMPE
ncbi:hypothetical protein [Haliangium ochraceum]|uniref:Uncharacterized protein n=1 Tax=Haliangium ochraceum (strain DSM 14365 / JCM 11303 / SMP-2) TaxID=502025 RepID=D0LPH9_HALO1|nr:hypothetical protein [Haliangium ochraceum]ACY13544.1 conserved hypothetical protein [Haliangium ochraceum DSM 14365]